MLTMLPPPLAIMGGRCATTNVPCTLTLWTKSQCSSVMSRINLRLRSVVHENVELPVLVFESTGNPLESYRSATSQRWIPAAASSGMSVPTWVALHCRNSSVAAEPTRRPPRLPTRSAREVRRSGVLSGHAIIILPPSTYTVLSVMNVAGVARNERDRRRDVLADSEPTEWCSGLDQPACVRISPPRRLQIRVGDRAGSHRVDPNAVSAGGQRHRDGQRPDVAPAGAVRHAVREHDLVVDRRDVDPAPGRSRRTVDCATA